jgi:hypothetical protein
VNATGTTTRVAWRAGGAGLRATARRLIESGADEDAIMRALREACPGLMLTTGPEWRRDAVYQNAIALEQMAAQKRRQARPQSAYPASGGAMSPGLVAFAEARGLVCAYCGRAGTRSSDHDGESWHRDSVPRGFQIDGRDLELACNECRADGERYHRLGGGLDAD